MTGWEMTWTVTRREFVERARDRSFAISTLTTVAIVLAVVILPRFLGFGGPDSYTVGIVGEPGPLPAAIEEAGPAFNLEVSIDRLEDEPAARAAVEGDRADIVVLPGGALLAESRPPRGLEAALQEAWRQVRIFDGLAAAGVSPGEAQQLLSPAPLEVRLLDREADRGALQTVAFLGMVVLYGQLFGYGMWVAMGIVEEKTTRVVEVLLAAIRPSHLLAGKIIGIGGLALLQLLLVAGLALGAVVLTGAVELPPGTLSQIGQVLIWFLLGYAFYSCAFAVAGAITTRQEELQNTLTPLTMLILISFFLAFAVLNDATSAIARFASLFPTSAPLAMPIRVAAGVVPAWEIALSAAITLAAGFALVPLAARIYSGAVLRTGSKIKLAEAWRATRS